MIEKQEFEQIFRRHYDGMFRLARRMLGDDAESKDVVSDVFALLLNKVRCGEFEIRNAETLQAYLLTSVRNRCINLLVHRQKEKQRVDELYSEVEQSQKAVVTVADASSLYRQALAETYSADTPPALSAGTEVS